MLQAKFATQSTHFCAAYGHPLIDETDGLACHVVLDRLPFGTGDNRSEQRRACVGMLETALQCHGLGHIGISSVEHTPDGAPMLTPPTLGSISLAHDGPWCAVALARVGTSIGVDIQTPRAVSMTIFQRLAPDLVPLHGQRDAFVEFAGRWTSREAVSKALGTGLRSELIRKPLPTRQEGTDFGVRYKRLATGFETALSLAWKE